MTKVLNNLLVHFPDAAAGAMTFAVIVMASGNPSVTEAIAAAVKMGHTTPEATTLVLALTFAAMASCNSAFIRYVLSIAPGTDPKSRTRPNHLYSTYVD